MIYIVYFAIYEVRLISVTFLVGPDRFPKQFLVRFADGGYWELVSVAALFHPLCRIIEIISLYGRSVFGFVSLRVGKSLCTTQ